jgi:hypothetical protein
LAAALAACARRKACNGSVWMRGDRVAAMFEDGSCAEGDVLVAADGGGSRERRQYLPHAERIDTDVAAIGGKVFIPVLKRWFFLAMAAE